MVPKGHCRKLSRNTERAIPESRQHSLGEDMPIAFDGHSLDSGVLISRAFQHGTLRTAGADSCEHDTVDDLPQQACQVRTQICRSLVLRRVEGDSRQNHTARQLSVGANHSVVFISEAEVAVRGLDHAV